MVTKNIFILEVRIQDTNPVVWRILEMKGTQKLHDLHLMIQIAMKWENRHLYEFKKNNNISYGIPELLDNEFINHSDLFRIKDVLKVPGDKIKYVYDFGDNWECEIELRGINHPEKKGFFDYPFISAGAYAAPPEDCGGISGYSDMCEAFRSKNKKEMKFYIEWLGKKWDPDAFNLSWFHDYAKDIRSLRKRESEM